MPNNPVTDPITDQKMSFAIGRDQILKRLWELATISPEVTRGSMAGQIKAISMIVAIEGLIPDRRTSPSQTQSAPPRAEAAAPQKPKPDSHPTPANEAPSPNLNPFIHPEPLNATRSLSLPLSLRKGPFPNGR